MKISYKISTLNLSEDIRELFCKIDKKIEKISKDKLNSVRFNLHIENLNRDVLTMKRLVFYKKILFQKIKCNTCLNNYNIDDIIDIINQYLTVGKVVNHKLKENNRNYKNIQYVKPENLLNSSLKVLHTL